MSFCNEIAGFGGAQDNGEDVGTSAENRDERDEGEMDHEIGA